MAIVELVSELCHESGSFPRMFPLKKVNHGRRQGVNRKKCARLSPPV
jgi:hypothetical protein